MFRVIMLSVTIVLMPWFAQAESIPEAVRRIDAKLQEWERTGVGKPGPRGPQGPRGARGPAGPQGDTATLEHIDSLTVQNKNGIGGLKLYSHEDGTGIQFTSLTGKSVSTITSHDDDELYIVFDGSLNIYKDNEQRVFIGNFREGNSGAFFKNKEGERKIELWVSPSGNGYVRVNGTDVKDYAEVLDLATRKGVRPGSVVAFDAAAGGLVPASAANARQVVGVISGAGGFRPGMVIGSRADGSSDLPVAMSGVVYVRVSDEAGAVQAGDLLVPSSVAGVGMRTADPGAVAGQVFGKALEPWSGAAEGLVRMLVMNR